MRLYKYTLFPLIFFSLVFTATTNARVVTFTRVTVDSVLYVPHGDWADNIDGTSKPYENDILATIAAYGDAVWYANNGKGASWSASHLIWTAPNYDYEIASADLDKNGTIDAVSTDMNNIGTLSLAVHTNTGGGSFTTKTVGSLSGIFRQMRLRDINNDGNIDIIATVCTSKFDGSLQTDVGLYWYENTGGMNFTQHLIGFCNPWKVDCFDDDGDNHLEVVITETYHGNLDTTTNCRLILYKNDGSEGFTPFILDNSFLPGVIGKGGAGVRCADLNNDGKIDIVSGDASGGILYWYENLGGCNFQRDTIDANCPAIDGIDVGDFEPDADMDIVVAGRDYWFRWYENDGNGNFTKHDIDKEYELFDVPYVSYFDGDSCPDVVLTESSYSGYVFAYLNPCPPQLI